jgi:hypothetical protein
MSESKQQRANHVSIEQYESGRAWRADADELSEPLGDFSEGALERGQFIMRLLEIDGESATDQMVSIAAVYDLGAGEAVAGLEVTVRPVFDDGDTGPPDRYTVTNDGIILNRNPNTPNFENGYFVGGPGIGEMTLEECHAMVLAEKAEAEADAVSGDQDSDRYL